MDKECIYCQKSVPIVKPTKNIPTEVAISKCGTLSITEYTDINKKGIIKRIAIQEQFCPECGRKFEGD